MPLDAEKNKVQNCYLGFLNCQNFGNFEFFQHFFFKKSSKISKFSKNRNISEEPLKNVCTKFQVIPFINVVFIAL